MLKKEVVIVCGYGCHLDTPLRPYLDRVAHYVQENQIAELIFCGGATQKQSAPGITEAGLMHSYVLAKVHILPPCLAIENNSYTSYENIEAAAEVLHGINGLAIAETGPRLKITIFCEAQRAPNVIMLARHFLLPFINGIDDITVETASWERADPFKQVRNLIYNCLAIKFPFLARRESKQRRERSKYI